MNRFVPLLANVLLALAPVPSQAADSSPGPALYARYCATCHGGNVRGDGPTAAVLDIAPPDLTKLAALNGGTFPMERVLHRIDGRESLVAHGSPMPFYGAFFDGAPIVQADTPVGPVSASRPVLELANFLSNLQR
ncbi:c-type cytochrome [Tropicimonas isoalkanivorans]|uniref:Cytochrome c n=1 Tax=Tropicimonas isoalkanivorans TaxID=441112 RepID=A0A1I1MXE2_9RHOB|nr:c-type cytochrome [Tropicimonas isoalkanivorans]SFC89776.1 Cytochrome c [Tropicimonas isoalkanivorans]